MKPEDHLGKSIACALSAACLLSIMNVVSKTLTETLNPIEVTFWRNLVALILLVPIVLAFKKQHLFKTKRIKGQFFRAFVGTIGMAMAVWMFSLLSLAEGIAISFTAPLFVIILSRPFLKETVGLPRIMAALIGFSGVLVIAQPWNELSMDTLGITVGLCFAALNASVILSLRWLGDTEASTTTVFYFLFFGLIGTGLFMPFIATPLPQSQWWLLGVLGFVGLVSLILKTESYRWGAAALVAPLSYSLLLWAIFFDWLIFDVVASKNILIGAGIIIASNAFILWREHHFNKKKLAASVPVGNG